MEFMQDGKLISTGKDGVWETDETGPKRVVAPEDMLRTATKEDIPEIRAILDHPEIRKTLDRAPLPNDLAEALDCMMFLLFGQSLFLLVPITPELFEVHVAVHPDDRGRRAIAAARAGMRMMFCASMCREIVGCTPSSNVGAQMFNRLVGLKPVRRIGRHRLWSITVGDWVKLLPTPQQQQQLAQAARPHGQVLKIATALHRVAWERRSYIQD